MTEIVIISGKGGTGKTSIAASFASLAKNKAVFADCDVDAADLHLILKPEIQKTYEFRSGHKAVIRQQDCTSCGECIRVCRFQAIKNIKTSDTQAGITFSVDPIACEGCGVCVRLCPEKAIDFPQETCGQWFISDTRFGPMVHARLGIAAGNSGRLVTLVRKEAKDIAGQIGSEYLLVDGSPGIGCPVIASLTASDLALIITEPTVCGIHDLLRIAGLTKQLGIPSMVCINKWDINTSVTEEIRNFSESHELKIAGLVRYDKIVNTAQRSGMAVTEFCTQGIAEDIKNVWKAVVNYVNY
ncbi:MAG: 4Fe-4S binding protein [Fibrobacter sp.]|nr:4Fe-4S binding protein [Fibrobacter sp.]